MCHIIIFGAQQKAFYHKAKLHIVSSTFVEVSFTHPGVPESQRGVYYYSVCFLKASIDRMIEHVVIDFSRGTHN
jgi:hypothetical protein